MKKNKQAENYLDRIPKRKTGIDWTEKDGIVTLNIENKGVFNKIAQKLFKKPKISYIHLDEFGSFVWKISDGGEDITALGERVKEKFAELANLPVNSDCLIELGLNPETKTLKLVDWAVI